MTARTRYEERHENARVISSKYTDLCLYTRQAWLYEEHDKFRVPQHTDKLHSPAWSKEHGDAVPKRRSHCVLAIAFMVTNVLCPDKENSVFIEPSW